MKIKFFVADKLKYDLINEGCFYSDVVYAIGNCLNNDYDSEDAFESDVRELLGVAADDKSNEFVFTIDKNEINDCFKKCYF